MWAQRESNCSWPEEWASLYCGNGFWTRPGRVGRIAVVSSGRKCRRMLLVSLPMLLPPKAFLMTNFPRLRFPAGLVPSEGLEGGLCMPLTSLLVVCKQSCHSLACAKTTLSLPSSSHSIFFFLLCMAFFKFSLLKKNISLILDWGHPNDLILICLFL